jgi:hypothetical protein
VNLASTANIEDDRMNTLLELARILFAVPSASSASRTFSTAELPPGFHLSLRGRPAETLADQRVE